MIGKRITGGGANNSPGNVMKRHHRYTAFVLLACLSCIAGFTMISKPAAQTQRTAAPLAVKLKAESRTSCRGTHLSVSAEITNTGAESLAIDMNFLWSRLSFRASSKKGKSGVGGSRVNEVIGDPGPSLHEPDYLILRPGDTFRKTKNLPLKDDFFQIPGKYLMQLTYGHFREATTNGVPVFTGTVTSNEIEFEITACAKRRKND